MKKILVAFALASAISAPPLLGAEPSAEPALPDDFAAAWQKTQTIECRKLSVVLFRERYMKISPDSVYHSLVRMRKGDEFVWQIDAQKRSGPRGEIIFYRARGKNGDGTWTSYDPLTEEEAATAHFARVFGIETGQFSSRDCVVVK